MNIKSIDTIGNISKIDIPNHCEIVFCKKRGVEFFSKNANSTWLKRLLIIYYCKITALQSKRIQFDLLALCLVGKKIREIQIPKVSSVNITVIISIKSDLITTGLVN